MNEESKKNIAVTFAVVMFGLAIFINWYTGSDTPNKDVAQTTGAGEVIGKTVSYDVLREWIPNGTKTSLGMEVLIDKQDVSVRNIKRLVRRLSEDREVAVIKVYQSKDAWLAERKGGDYTDVQRRGYMAYFIKGKTGSEIRWMQSTGELEELDGTREQI